MARMALLFLAACICVLWRQELVLLVLIWARLVRKPRILSLAVGPWPPLLPHTVLRCYLR